ncbi:MAG: hypothetical protein EX271_12855, partial [Acidimicrobiales bacterium]
MKPNTKSGASAAKKQQSPDERRKTPRAPQKRMRHGPLEKMQPHPAAETRKRVALSSIKFPHKTSNMNAIRF